MFRHTFTAVATAVLALALGGVAAGCASSPSAPGVASLGGPTTPVSSAGNGAGSQNDMFAKALKFSQCMRSHGVPKFPDPIQSGGSGGGGGGVQLRINAGSGIDPQSSTFQAAQKACQSLMPAGGPGGGRTNFDPTKVGAWTSCIRSHGVPNFPDPKNTGNGMQLDLSGTNIDPNKMQPALRACQSKFPGGDLAMSSGGPKGTG